MGWTTLTLRKTELRREHAEQEKRLLQISREKRQLERELHYEETCCSNRKTTELKTNEFKQTMDSLKETRPDVSDSEAYQEWQTNYMSAKEDYEAAKVDINEYWDGVISDIEEESADRETLLEQEQTEIEASMEDVSQEIQSVGQAISTDIQSTALKLS